MQGERALGLGTSCAPSSAPPEQGNDTEMALPAALRGAVGAENGAPWGWALARPRVEEGRSGSSWAFWCMMPFFLWDGMCTALPLLWTRYRGEPTLPRPQVCMTGLQVLGTPASLPAMTMLTSAQLCWCL